MGLSKTTAHSLVFSDGSTTLTTAGLYLDRSHVLNRALRTDNNALRLVRAVDKRVLLQLSSIAKQYNVRIPAPSTTTGSGLYYDASLDSGSTAWTWQTMLDDIWDKLPTAFAGATGPTLPSTPDGTPENFRFIGVSAWDALFVVLDHLGMSVAYDPIADTFSYVDLGVFQTGLVDAKAALAGRLIYDFNPDPVIADAQPETIRVFFWRRELYQGIEKDTVDTDNWEMMPYISKDVASAASSIAGTVLPVWDTLPATIDAAGSTDNDTALDDRADYIASAVELRLGNAHSRQRYLYAGIATTIRPGEEVREVRWRDYGDGHGPITEILQGADADRLSETSETSAAYHHRSFGYAPGVGGENTGCGMIVVGEGIAPGDLSRNQYPLFPRVAQWVQADDGASSAGASLTPNAAGLIPGFVIRYTGGGTYEQLDPCWIRPGDLHSNNSESAVIKLKQKDRYDGRLYGVDTSGGDTRPVYTVRAGSTNPSEVKWGIATTNWVDNGSSCDHVVINPVDDCEGSNPDTGTNVTVLLPKNASNDGMDPNVIANAVIAYAEAADGSNVCTSDYLDDKIGTVKMWARSAGTIPPGWGLMDGTANSPGNGGSGVNMSQVNTEDGTEIPFVRYGTPGSSGGKRRHKHTLNLSIGGNVAFASFASSLSQAIGDGITIQPHTVEELIHVHNIPIGTDIAFQSGATTSTPIHQTNQCTFNPVGAAHEAAADPCPSGDWGPLEHRISGYVDAGTVGTAFSSLFSSIFGDGSIEEEEHIPPYQSLLFIERLDNSV